MKCVILAAGKGTRMYPLTKEIPKPMLTIHGKTLLEYKIEQLPDEIDEVIFIIGYLGQQIKEYFSREYKGRKITYITQEKLEGTGKAIWCAKDLLFDPFLVMMGDDIYHKDDISACARAHWAMVVHEMQSDASGGLIEMDKEGNFKSIQEGVHHREGALINTGLYKLNPTFFDYPLVKLSNKKEWGLPQTLACVAQQHCVKLIKSKGWIQITHPDDLGKAKELLLHF